MPELKEQKFLTGAHKYALFARVSIHVVFRYGRLVLKGNLGLTAYVKFLYRALLFLNAMRHGKVVKLGRLYHLHLYVPAYPAESFFSLLNKLISPEPGPGTVVFSMTKACRYKCPHCYQREDAGQDLDVALMTKVAKQMEDAGVSFFDIEGGEPFLRPERVNAILEALGDRAESWINTTGDKANFESIKALVDRGLCGVMVSIHSPFAAVHDAFTGIEGSFKLACDFLRECRHAGIFTAINCCPNPEAVMDGDLEKLLALAAELDCSYVQIIQEKAAGAWLARAGEDLQGETVVQKLRQIHLKYNGGGRFKRYPSISAQVFEEGEHLFGCTCGGVDRFYIGADGEIQPCEFLNVSFGNVQNEDFMTIFRRMRGFFKKPGTKWLCCTEAASIRKALMESGLKRTPLPWPLTKELVEAWDKGKETPLYKRIGIYDKL